MHKLLRFAAIAAFLALFLPLNAADNLNIVNIIGTDGSREQLALHEKLDMKISPEGALLLIHPEVTVEYPLGELNRLEFAHVANPGLYKGDHEAGIDAPQEPDNRITITPDAINCADSEAIAAFDIQGRKVAEAKGSLSLNRLPKGGVYIVRIGSTSLKIKR
ncbi:MAG: hypothetical protein K2N10_08725 [Muribaculaceae bacterium]|nr:hypothetical protein [Muribaculaceae bacterium]